MKVNNKSGPFINIHLSDHLADYRSYIDFINDIAEDSKFFRILPVLNRILLENLLRDIISSSLEGEYNYLYYNQSRGRVRNFSTLIDLFNKLRKNFRGSFAVDIPDDIIGYLDKFRKDGNYSSHKLVLYINSNYMSEIKGNLAVTISILVQLYQKIINSGKKIVKVDEKSLKIEDKKFKNIDISNVLRLISSIRNEVGKTDAENENISINLKEKEKIQKDVNDLHIVINKMDLSTDTLVGVITNLGKFELILHSKEASKNSLLNYIEFISAYFKANLIYVSRSDKKVVEQHFVINKLKKRIYFLIAFIVGFFISFFSFRIFL